MKRDRGNGYIGNGNNFLSVFLGNSCPMYRGYVGVYVTGQVLSPFSTVQEADQPLPISKNQSSTFERIVLFVLCRQASFKVFSFSAIYLLITPKHAISDRGKP